ncbi:MAG: glutamate--tRNA ligase [Gammaproteobacteria bacterium]|nr:glutamate--tRNA ligase [Gammaproteobacteria bacterium]
MRAMQPERIKTRFAPSPTGYLHLGNARTALFNALYAYGHGGVFLLRVEDTDRERSSRAFIDALQEDLNWLGLRWQEGPLAGGAAGPYLQSQRDAVYRRYFDALERQGLAYPCFCSDQTLREARAAQRAAGQPPRYPGTCARLEPREVEQKLRQGLAPTLRFRVPRGRRVEFLDSVRGAQSFASDDIGDFIIRRADGSPAFFFSNAVDDALMDVTDVLRGEDHLANTPRQILLLEALELPLPRYGHIPLIVGADGSPLSKRHGSRSLRELRQAGYLPLAVVNYLARLGHGYDADRLLDLEALAAAFDPARLGRAPARYDEAQLLHWQREALAHGGVDELWDWMGSEVHARVPVDLRQAFVEALRHNVALPEEATRWARILYSDPLDMGVEAAAAVHRTGGRFFEQALAALPSAGNDYPALVRALKQATGAAGKALFQPLRAALTGETHGPELARLYALMPAERIHRRLQAARDMAQGA